MKPIRAPHPVPIVIGFSGVQGLTANASAGFVGQGGEWRVATGPLYRANAGPN